MFTMDVQTTVFAGTACLLGLQAMIMFMDEVICHRQRGLGLFERVGHPVDTLVFSCTTAVAAWTSPTTTGLIVFMAMALVSSLVITKDEFIHAAHCRPFEHWLHAVLFVLHAPLLVGIGCLWAVWGDSRLAMAATPLSLLWACFQAVYWLRPRPKNRMPLARPSFPAEN